LTLIKQGTAGFDSLVYRIDVQSDRAHEPRRTIMNKNLLSALLLGLALGFSTLTFAATISERINIAHQRIEQGIRSGALTRDEARRLKDEFSRVRHDEARAKSDGRLDRRERERLDQELNRLERHISQLKHNGVNQRR
jgi:septal ring factor EnvC (AmiA/AmiB activator)